MSDQPSQPAPRSVALVELLLGLGIVALGLFIIIETSQIHVGPTYAKVGPKLFPSIVGGGLILLGACLAIEAARGRMMPTLDTSLHAPSDWRAILIISIGLWLQILLFERAGFVIASAILFFCVAYAFGSRRYLRDAAIAVILALVVYAGFTRGLDLTLPAGVLKGIL